jgi:hypothetical protein
VEKEREELKRQLDKELQSVKFSLQQEVLSGVRRQTFRQKLSALLNKEVEIPLLPVGAIVALFFSWGIKDIIPEEKQTKYFAENELIEAGGNTYRKDLYEKAAEKNEN